MQKGLWKCHEPRVTTNQEIPTVVCYVITARSMAFRTYTQYWCYAAFVTSGKYGKYEFTT